MTDPHEQVFHEVQRYHITALSPEVQRCRLAAIGKLEEGMDGRAGPSVEFLPNGAVFTHGAYGD